MLTSQFPWDSPELELDQENFAVWSFTVESDTIIGLLSVQNISET